MAWRWLSCVCCVLWGLGQVTGIVNDTVVWCSGTILVHMNVSARQWVDGSTTIGANIVPFSQPPNIELIATSFLYRKNYILFSDRGTRTLFLFRDNPHAAVFAHVGVSRGVGELAVDWLNFNVYWCDSIYSWIGLQALPRDLGQFAFNDKQKIVVEKSLEKPYGIAVSPQRRLLFWTDYGRKPRVERSSLLGEDRRSIIWTGIVRPLSLTLDPDNQRLYWLDNARATLETCDFEGQGRRVLLQRLGLSLKSIAVFQDHLFYTEDTKRTIHVVSKDTGEQSAVDLAITNLQPTGIAVFSGSLQPFTSSVCDNASCSHICVEEAGGARCLCDGGFALQPDGKACTAVSSDTLWKVVVYTNGTSICAFPVTTFNSYKFLPIDVTCLTSGNNINFLSADAQSSSLYYSQGTSIRKKTIGGGEITVTTTSTDISGFVFDPKTKTLVWSERGRGIVQAIGTDVNARSRTVVANALSPTTLALDSDNSRLFWVSEQSPVRIYSVSVYGGSSVVLVDSGLLKPSRLTYDRQRDRLYWNDDDGRIGSIRTDGSGRTSLPGNPVPDYTGIAVFKDYVVWTTAISNVVKLNVAVVDGSNDNFNKTDEFTIPNIGSVTDIVVYDEDIADATGADPCGTDNGGCPQMCLPQGTGSVCRCYFGYALQSDGKCKANVVDSNFFLVLDDVHSRLYQINRDNSAVHGVNVLPDNKPSSIVYDWVRRTVIWYDSGRHLINKAGLDGAGEAVVTSTESRTVHDIAVDPSTGILYYTATTSTGAGELYITTQDGLVKKRLKQTSGQPGPLAIYPRTGILVWGEGTSVKMTDMSGHGLSTLVSSGLTGVKDLEIDADGTTLYIADEAGDKIEMIKLQTRSRVTLRQNIQEYPIAIAARGDNLYYLTRSGRSVKAINKNTGQEAASLSAVAEFGHLSDLYVYSDDSRLVNEQCANVNGGCSTLCLPTSSGRVCACADGVNLDQSQRVCAGVTRCPTTVQDGALSSDCTPYPNSVCSFTCDEGHVRSTTSPLACDTGGRWNVSLGELCLVVTTPASPSLAGPIAGAVVGVLLLLVFVAAVVFLYRKRKEKQSIRRQLSTASTIPMFTLSKPDEIYDEIGPKEKDPNRYVSFRRVSPGAARRQMSGPGSDSSSASYIGVDQLNVPSDRCPIPLPRPASSFTPNTRRKMGFTESPAPDYDLPRADSKEYLELINVSDGLPRPSLYS